VGGQEELLAKDLMLVLEVALGKEYTKKLVVVVEEEEEDLVVVVEEEEDLVVVVVVEEEEEEEEEEDLVAVIMEAMVVDIEAGSLIALSTRLT
jgi:hypothetical protein